MRAVFDYFEMKLNGRFSVEQVFYAIGKYTDEKNDIPTPADIIKILNPEKPRITEAQFVEAQKWQERNNWPIFSDAQTTIENYRRQDKDERAHFNIENKKILSMAASVLKRIE